MHVVPGAAWGEDLLAEHLQDAEARDAGLVLMEIEAGMAGDRAVGMAGDVAGIGPGRRQVRVAAIGCAQDEANAHAGLVGSQYGISTISKPVLGVPQSGQTQSSGISAQRVPGAMPCSGSPRASS